MSLQAAQLTKYFPPWLVAWRLDLLLLLGLCCLNPLLWGWRFPPNITPDAITYIRLALDGIAHGKLSLSGWAHIDLAMVLPPLYPSLIYLGTVLGLPPIVAAIHISTVCMVLLTIPLYFMVRRAAGAWVAAGTTLLVQLNIYYLFFGSAIGTEALFLLLLTCALCLAMRRTTAMLTPALALTLGVTAGLVFIARQVGLVLLPFLVIWVVIDLLRHKGNRADYGRELAFMLCGWVLIVGLYTAALYVETGASPLRQTFRLNSYVVQSEDPSVWELIASNDPDDATEYVDMYARRRFLRTLLPDSSEMLAFVQRPDGDIPGETEADIEIAGHVLPSLPAFAHNLLSNINHLRGPLGLPLTLLAVAAGIAAAFGRRCDISRATRLMLPAFVAFYVVALSALTGIVARYMVVTFPLIWALIGVELGAGLREWNRLRRPSRLGPILAIAAGAVILLLSGHSLVNLSAPSGNTAVAKLSVQTAIPSREPTFALLPVNTYLAGGSYRILPNDSLDKVVRYARFTGVRWLLVPRHPETVIETRFYGNAPWLADPSALARRKDLLRYCCTAFVPEEHLLFEILPAPSTTP